MLDEPGDRSLHQRPTPRTGGVAILIAVFSCTLAGAYAGINIGGQAALLLIAAALIGAVSYIDDRAGLHPGVRIAVHFAVAIFLIFSGFSLTTIELPGLILNMPPAVGVLISMLFVVWMINLYNFMDGMDGFAAGMTVSGFGTFALFGGLNGNPEFLFVNLIIASAAAGFLIFNFPPARVFMGDVGSATLGLLLGAMTAWGAQLGIVPIWAGMLIFSPFVVDATVTLIRRIVRGERVWSAHKTHYYQQLVQLGWGHRKTVFVEYILMISCAVTAIFLLRASVTVQWLGVGAWGLVYALVFSAIARSGRRGRLPIKQGGT